MKKHSKGFTLVELLIVIGILATLATIAIVIINPVEIIKETKDSTRIQEIKNVDKAIRLGLLFNPALLSTSTTNIVYTSLPDVNGNINDNCNIDYPTLPYLSSPWEYRCNAILANLLKIDGTGWLPINFNSISGGAGLNKLPIDPNNTVTGNLYYTYSLGSSNNYSLSANLQSNKYLAQVANNDGGNATSSFETAPIAWTTISTPWYNTSWLYRQQITISNSMVASSQSNFPVLIKLTNQNNALFNNAQSDGDDILFTLSDGVTKLNHEIERYQNVSTKELDAWVKIPSLSSVSDTVIYMYYGNGSVLSQQNKTAVWDSGYKMVQHLHEISGTHYDSTVNAKNGTPQFGVSQNAVGQIGGADSFDGVDDYIDTGNLLFYKNNYTWTFSAWVKAAGGSSIFSEGANATTPFFVIRQSGGGKLNVSGTGGGWEQNANLTSNSFVFDNTWKYITITDSYSAPTSTVNIYINGVWDGGNTYTRAGTFNTDRSGLGVFRRMSADGDYLGLIDEVRLSTTARTAGWIQTEYNNQSNPSTYLIFSNQGTQ